MLGLRYLENVATLKLDREKCTGCGMCATVCPHAVFGLVDKKARILDRDACMECGACAMNCPVEAVSVEAGVGCATGILSGVLQAVGASKEACECDPNVRKSPEPRRPAPDDAEEPETSSDRQTDPPPCCPANPLEDSNKDRRPSDRDDDSPKGCCC